MRRRFLPKRWCLLALSLALCGSSNAQFNFPGIDVTGVSATTVCPGAPLTVTYTATGLQPGNVFAAWLIPATGNTYHPHIIGTLSAHGSGSMQVRLPNVIAPGNYRIQIQSNDTLWSSWTLSSPITVRPVATFIRYGPAPLCALGTVSPVITGTAGGVFSAPPGVSINPATGVVDLGLSVPGKYRITYTYPGGTCSEAHTELTITPRPEADPPASQDVCSGTPTAPVVFTGSAAYYDWTNSNPAIGLPASGRGPIPAFTPVNTTGAAITATITVTPRARKVLAFAPAYGSTSLTVYNTANDSVERRQTVPFQPLFSALSPDSSRLYLVTRFHRQLLCLDTETGATIGTTLLGDQPAGVRVSPDGRRLFVACLDGVYVYGAQPLTLEAVVPVGGAAYDVRLSPDGRYAFASVPASDYVAAINTSTLLVERRITVGNRPLVFNSGPQHMTLSPDGQRLYVPIVYDGIVRVINTATLSVQQTIDVGDFWLGALTVSPDGNTLYISSWDQYRVLIHDALTGAHLGQMSTPWSTTPAGLGVVPGEPGRLYAGTSGNAAATLVFDTEKRQLAAVLRSGDNSYNLGETMAGVPGCAGTPRTFTITVQPAGAATLRYDGSPFCGGPGTAAPTITSTPGGTFSAPSGLAIDAATGVINLGTSLPGTYTVSYAYPCGGTAATATVQIEQRPAVTLDYGSGPLCAGSGTAAPALTGPAGGSFSATPAGLSLSTATGLIDLSGSVPGTYSVVYALPAGGACPAGSGTATVTVRAPEAVGLVADQQYCAGALATPPPFTGATAYSWTNSNPAIGLPAAGSGHLPAFVASNGSNAPASAQITVTSAGSSCPGPARTFSITVHPAPQGLLLRPADSVLCPGTPVPLHATGGTSYQWSVNGVPIAGATGALFGATGPGRYTVQVTNAAGCSAPAPGFVTLRLPPTPAVAFEVADTCQHATARFRNPAGNSALRYSWTFGDGNSSLAEAPAHRYATPGTYTVTLQVSLPACSAATASLTRPVTILPAPAAQRLPDVWVRAGGPQQLEARLLAGARYTWTPGAPLSDPASANPVLLTDSDELFRIGMLLPNGCVVTDTLQAKAYSEVDILVADGFTPNNDGRNDRLHAVPRGIRAFRYFRIYNRWGALVFETTDSARGWDGTYKGTLQGGFSFVWIAEGVGQEGQRVLRKGTVTVIR
ncbi:PKD domain-containing protein [Flaviaesturariibacter amylovorans]|uniref:PKD domain-containing protein n=1 Tax=Flaviaesturariibacter amylovorans TaxID=1084520 RepID=A0ABP8HTR6_9BACT